MAQLDRPNDSELQDKFTVWKTLAVKERLERVGASVQKVKDAPYAADSYEANPKFERGDPVAVCHTGLYYHAVVQKVEEKAYYCGELKKDVPLYIVRYPGWGRSQRHRDEAVVEYDLVGTTKRPVAHELLYAHYWNKYSLSQLEEKVGKDQLKSIFELPTKTLQKLEHKWIAQIKRENPKQDLTFAQWVGLEPEEA